MVGSGYFRNDAFNRAVEVPDHNIVFTDKGEAVAAWHAFDGNDYRIYVARINIDGVLGDPVALSKSGHHAKLPSMAIGDDGSSATFTDISYLSGTIDVHR
jgi:hypothetical protein